MRTKIIKYKNRFVIQVTLRHDEPAPLPGRWVEVKTNDGLNLFQLGDLIPIDYPTNLVRLYERADIREDTGPFRNDSRMPAGQYEALIEQVKKYNNVIRPSSYKITSLTVRDNGLKERFDRLPNDQQEEWIDEMGPWISKNYHVDYHIDGDGYRKYPTEFLKALWQFVADALADMREEAVLLEYEETVDKTLDL